jgi:hypothetical protein
MPPVGGVVRALAVTALPTFCARQCCSVRSQLDKFDCTAGPPTGSHSHICQPVSKSDRRLQHSAHHIVTPGGMAPGIACNTKAAPQCCSCARNGSSILINTAATSCCCHRPAPAAAPPSAAAAGRP